MKKIGLLSDTHGFLPKNVFEHFKDVDEIWHAGDIGKMEVVELLEDFKPTRAVFGNIDGGVFRAAFDEDLFFEIEGLRIWMTHIGGYPKRYSKRTREMLVERAALTDLFICGHSHILKVMFDKKHQMLCMNPGAAGKIGRHKVCTMLRFSIEDARAKDLEVIEFDRHYENAL